MWGTPETFAAKNAVITQACEAIGRDPATLRRSTQALVVLGRDPVPEDGPRAIGGSVERLRDTFGRYAAAGVDEFITPDGHLKDPERSRELYDLLAEEVVPAVTAGPQQVSGAPFGP